MLFMMVYTYEPQNREAVIKKRTEKGQIVPQGLKIVGEWSALAGGRVFRLIEGDDPRAILAGANPWADLGKIEVHPVMPTEDVIKLLAAKK
jgi:hypothetical protein